MKHIGLFAGIGGFEIAAAQMGWETVAWCEWNPFCQHVLKYYFPEADGHGDITKTDFTKYADQIDILTGGFPCQPYSNAGKRMGKDDIRHLWPQMLRAITEIRPRWIIGENVSGIVSWNEGLVFEEVCAELEAKGYEVQPCVLPAVSVGAPHRRDRVWFVARRIKQHGEFGIPNNNANTKNNGLERFGRLTETISSCGKRWAEWYNARIVENDNLNTDSLAKIGRLMQRIANRQRFGSVGRDEDFWANWPTEPPICSGNDGLSPELARITVSAKGGRRTLTAKQAISRHRQESIKGYGNAIVPQVAIQLYKAIVQIDSWYNSSIKP
jgi:DNA (cytosine-5)-methyltransferase 1